MERAGDPLEVLKGGSGGRFRRVSPTPVRPGEGRLTEPTAAIQPRRRERFHAPFPAIHRGRPAPVGWVKFLPFGIDHGGFEGGICALTSIQG